MGRSNSTRRLASNNRARRGKFYKLALDEGLESSQLVRACIYYSIAVYFLYSFHNLVRSTQVANLFSRMVLAMIASSVDHFPSHALLLTAIPFSYLCFYFAKYVHESFEAIDWQIWPQAHPQLCLPFRHCWRPDSNHQYPRLLKFFLHF